MSSKVDVIRCALGLALAAIPVTAFSQDSDSAAASVVFPHEFVPQQRRDQGPDTGAQPKILDGYYVEPGELPFQVALIDGYAGIGEEVWSQFCGGSLIAPDWVLTAAHCVQRSDGDRVEVLYPEDVDVLFGSVFLNKGHRAKVAEIIVNENYDPLATNNDVALLRLAEPVHRMGKDVGLINLPSASDAREPKIGSTVTVSGWGQTETGDFPVQLKAVDVELIARDACNASIRQAQFDIHSHDLAMIFARMGVSQQSRERIVNEILTGEVISEAMICAGFQQGGKDSCQGDSGGPLFVKNADGSFIQVGIVSWGISCGEPELYGVYTNLGEFADWVRDQMQ